MIDVNPGPLDENERRPKLPTGTPVRSAGLIRGRWISDDPLAISS
jgi:hypothetical protein